MSILGGIVFIVLGTCIILNSLMKIKRCTETTTGTLAALDVRTERDSGARRNYYVPIYSYEVDGKVYQNEAKKYSTKAYRFEINSQGKVKYNPLNPEECIIDGRPVMIFFAILFILLGLFLCFAGR